MIKIQPKLSRYFVRREVDVNNINNEEELSPLELIMASFRYYITHTKSYEIKLEKKRSKELRAQQQKIETLRQYILTILNEELFQNKTLDGIGVAKSVSFYIDQKYEDVLIDVLRGHEMSGYISEIINPRYELKISFEKLPIKVKFTKRVLQ